MTQSLQQLEAHLQRELGRIVLGAERSVHALAIALVARGHVLVQGAPGLGKTLLAKSLARQLGASHYIAHPTAQQQTAAPDPRRSVRTILRR